MGAHTIPSAVDAARVLQAIRRMVHALHVASRAAERDYGLSAAQLFVLQKLAENRAISLNDLAARTLTHQSSVSVVVQRLVARGLVHRAVAGEDRRRIVLSLTARGRAIARRLPEAAQHRLIAAVQRLPASQRRDLARLLERVADTAAGRLEPPLFFEDAHPSRKRKSNVTRRH
jgi:DNA-binding MarR family transcriptional regulator